MNDGRTQRGSRPWIRPAAQSDLPAVLALLESRGLPTAGVAEWIDEYVVASGPDSIVGAAGLERYADGAVLRSVAVADDAAGRGVGRALVEAVLSRAVAAGVPAVWLLTTTAERWFPRFGFRVTDRLNAPAGVAGSVEFREACPASAVAMVLDGAGLTIRNGGRRGQKRGTRG